MQFDLGKISKGDLVKELDRGDVAAGSTDRVISWRDNQILEVQWTPQETKPMSVTGIKAGDVKGILQKVRDRQAASLAKVADLATKSEAVASAMDNVTGAAHKELDDTLAELGQFSNLGPNLEG